MENHDKLVRLTDIAERCGVSKMTVSRVLRGDTSHNTMATVELVRKVANEMGYDPTRQVPARRLRMSKSGERLHNKTLGLLFDLNLIGMANYYRLIFQGVLSAVVEENYQLLLADEWNMLTSSEVPVAYRRGDVDGLLSVSVPGLSWDVLYSLLRDDPGFGDRPIVGLVEHQEGCSGVYGDHFDAGYQVMNHLLDLGHQYVMLMGTYHPDGKTSGDLRAAGYRKAYGERNMDALSYLVPSLWNPADVEVSRRRMIRQLQLHPEATALIGRNDYETISAYEALTQEGIRVPEDISLISYDDTESIVMRDGENILTSVRFPLKQIGYEGTNLLIRRILNQEKEDRDIVLPVELIIRKSTSPPARK